VAFCEITLGGKGLNGTSDINGRFSIRGVPVGNYALTVQKDGYEKYSEDFFIKQRGQIIYVRLPSQNQLLDLVDEALAANNFVLAEELAERAYRIDPNNIEALFYFATVKYRQRDYDAALTFLEAACELGSKDPYIDKFMALLKEAQDANSWN
jgi:tetratricopeptide (TPR) repeat protein